MSEIKVAGRQERSAMDNLIIMNTIKGNERAQKLNTYMFFADAVKCFDKLWLKDCLLECIIQAMIQTHEKLYMK